MLVVFAYAFEHKKTYEGLMMLLAQGLKPDVVIAAGFKKLSVKHSPTRVAPQGLSFPTAESVCRQFSIDYREFDHDSPELVDELSQLRPSTGVILGARILKQPVISVFSKGILNLHPGVLPDNRGLDNLKWAVLGRLPQGVTSHLIDSKVDRGRLITKRIVEVFADDSLLDVNVRIQNVEMSLLAESIREIEARDLSDLPLLDVGGYHTAMDAESDARMLREFPAYCADYAAIRAEYEARA